MLILEPIIPEFSCCRYNGSTLNVLCRAALVLTLQEESRSRMVTIGYLCRYVDVDRCSRDHHRQANQQRNYHILRIRNQQLDSRWLTRHVIVNYNFTTSQMVRKHEFLPFLPNQLINAIFFISISLSSKRNLVRIRTSKDPVL